MRAFLRHESRFKTRANLMVYTLLKSVPDTRNAVMDTLCRSSRENRKRHGFVKNRLY